MTQAVRIGFGLFTWLLVGTATAFSAAPAHKAVQYGDQALAFSSGFIREQIPIEGTVAKTAYNRQVVGHGDTVYLRMQFPEDVVPGSLYTVYRKSRKVFHPANGHYLGNLIAIIGVVQVTKIDGNLATAKVEQGYMWIAPGDLVMAFASPSVEEVAVSDGRLDTTGMIVDIQIPRTLVAQSNIVFLDLGRVDGLQVGDRLDVLRSRRGFPTESIGELKILATEDMTSTALVSNAVMPVAVGDQAVPKEVHEATRVSHPQSTSATPVSPSTKARESLTKSLHQEIATGDVTVEQVGDTVTISLNDLVNQLEYESGEAQVKPTGRKILKQIGEYLKQDTENDILVEGHTDNQRIGPTLVKQYPTNQELSEARADLVVRYFIDAGIDPSSLAAIGYADTRPRLSNASEEGRKRNRRIQIVLTPKPADAPEEPKSAELPPAEPTTAELKPAELRPAELQPVDVEPIETLHVNVPKTPDTAMQDTATPSERPLSSN
jgi:chemotaxis protein MotB